jgi:two-component system chemotaxis response regulator CheY
MTGQLREVARTYETPDSREQDRWRIGSSMRALIVDDSKAMRMIIKRTLRQAGFLDWEIDEAPNGKQALRKIRIYVPDLVFCEWNMPGMTGLDLLNEIQARGLETCFGFVTAEGTSAMREIALDAGVKFYISKPFTVEAFKRALSPVLISLIDREAKP